MQGVYLYEPLSLLRFVLIAAMVLCVRARVSVVRARAVVCLCAHRSAIGLPWKDGSGSGRTPEHSATYVCVCVCVCVGLTGCVSALAPTTERIS
jgi:hypothetical protein